MGKVDVDDLSFGRRRYSRWAAYGQTKLANLLFSTELQRRAADHGTDLLAAAAHPGYAATNLTSGPALWVTFPRPLLAVGYCLVGQPDHLGASRSSTWRPCPTCSPTTTGALIRGGSSADTRRAVGCSERARDPEAARRLWERSEELTGVTYPGPAA